MMRGRFVEEYQCWSIQWSRQCCPSRRTYRWLPRGVHRRRLIEVIETDLAYRLLTKSMPVAIHKNYTPTSCFSYRLLIFVWARDRQFIAKVQSTKFPDPLRQINTVLISLQHFVLYMRVLRRSNLHADTTQTPLALICCGFAVYNNAAQQTAQEI